MRGVLPPFVYRAVGVVATFAVFACILIPITLISTNEMDLDGLLLFSVTFIAGYVLGQLMMLYIPFLQKQSVVIVAYIGIATPLLASAALSIGFMVPVQILYLLWFIAGMCCSRITEGWFLNLSISRGFWSAKSLAVIGGAILITFMLAAFSRPPILQATIAFTYLIVSALSARWFLRVKKEEHGLVRSDNSDVIPSRLGVLFAVHGFVYGLLASHIPHLGIADCLLVLGFALAGLLIFLLRFHANQNIVIDLAEELVHVTPILAFILVATPQVGGIGETICVGLTAATFSYFLAVSVSWLLRIARRDRKLSSELMLKVQLYIWFGILIGILAGFLVGNAQCTSGACLMLSIVYTTIFVLATVVGTRNIHLDEEKLLVGVNPEIHASGVEDIVRERLHAFAADLGLSPRETEVIIVFAREKDVDSTSQKLVISPSTTRTHLYRIYSKLHLNSVQELEVYLRDKNLMFPDDER